MAIKFENVFELMRETADGVVRNQDNWKDFLNTAAMNYKRPFHNQLLIYNQRPDATACATYDYWNQKQGRFVKKGSKGIATLNLASQKTEILFDISDTGSNTNRPVPIWTVTDEMYSVLGSVLQEHFDTAVSSGDLVAVLFEVGNAAADDALPMFSNAIRLCKDGSGLEALDDVNLEKALRETLANSLTYVLLKRCNIEPEEYSESLDFSYIDCFDSYDTLAVLGKWLNTKSNELFKDIALTVRSIEKTFALSENKDKEAEKNGSDIQTRGGLSDPEHLSSQTADELREVRNAETNVSSEREVGNVHSNDVEGDAEPTSDGDRRESDGVGEQIDSGNGVEGGRDRDAENDQPDEVGGADEQLSAVSSRDSSERDDLRLSAETENLDKDHPDLSLEYVLTNVLRHHKYLKASGAEIQNFFIDHVDEAERIAFVRAAYNQDYTELLTEDNARVGYHAGSDGLEVWIGAYLGSNSRVVVPWPIVVEAINVLVNNDEFLSLSEKVDIPTEEQQNLYVADLENGRAPATPTDLSLPQQVIDEVICSGSNETDSIYNICAHYKRHHSIDENVKFLADEYGSGTGKGFIIDGESYSVVFEEDGIRIAEGKGVFSADNACFMPWAAVDKRIKELLNMGRYLSSVDYEQVEEHLLDKIANSLWSVRRDVLNDDIISALNLKAYGDLSSNLKGRAFSEEIDALKNVLSDREKVSALVDDTLRIIDACKGKAPRLRVSAYKLKNLGEAFSCLNNLNSDVIEYPVESSFAPSYKSFITSDEVEFDLMQGSHFEHGKYRIYLFFNEPHTSAEKTAFLKNEYGIGGGNGALGGVFTAHHDHDGKGIVLSKGSISKPFDTVTLSWSSVAHLLEKLIEEERYLTSEEIEALPDYEKHLLATEIYNFFSDAPLDIERPHLLSSSREASVDEIAKLLDEQENVNNILENMHAYMLIKPKDARNYHLCETYIKDVERFASGISLFDFEARKPEFDALAASSEAQEAPALTDAQETGDEELANELSQEASVREIAVGDVVSIGPDRFEIMSLDEAEVVLNDVAFPLYVQTFTIEDFLKKVNENPSNVRYKFPDINLINQNPQASDSSDVSGDVSRENLHNDTAGADAPVSELSEAHLSEEPVYRYYYRLKHPDDGYPVYEDNKPLNIVTLDDRPYIEDFGIYSSGYVEYAKPLSVDDLNKFDLMLYEPPIVSQNTLKRYQLGFGMLGNGTTVWNRLELEGRDYKTVAHISEQGEVTVYDLNMPREALDRIQSVADKDKVDYQNQLLIAAEALAEAEKRHARKPEINRRTTVCKNYNAFKKFAGDVLSGKYTYMRFESGPDGYEPLYVERIGENTIAMAHTYVQNGDLMYDPEMTFTFDNDKEELQALSYELSGMGLYQNVNEGSHINLGLQRELNSFLKTWLKNINEQAQPLVKAIDRDDNEIDFTGNPVEADRDNAAFENIRDDNSSLSMPAVINVGDSFAINGEEFAVKSIEGVGADMDEVVLESTVTPGKVAVTTYGAIRDVLETDKDEQNTPAQTVENKTHKQRFGFDFDEYLKIKDLYPDDIVAYQVGDFYEFFGEDAEKVAKELNLTLTSRDVGLSERLAMCGIPSYKLENYLDILIQNGLNVAVHGYSEKAGKVVTVDYETELSSARSSQAGVLELADEEDKLVFEPERYRAVDAAPKSLNRANAVDYVIEDLEHSAKSSKERFRQNIAAITLLKQLEAENRLANADEQKVLANYVGWGGLSDAFDENKTSWASEFKDLKDLLTPEEYASAKSSTLSAFYTSPTIIKFMYDTLENMGFKKGNILEPSCGVGNFIGMLPESMSGSKVYGVELDSVSGRIAQQLYQRQDIRVQGFEKTDFPDSFFDVAIGNVPFGDFKVNDKQYNKNNFLIHDYFFAKALDKVRPGGIVAFITSKGTLDKANPAVRQYIAQRAELLGAVRLPDNAFKANAGTEVTSDIIFLQKRDKPIEIDADREDWLDLSYLYDQETGAIVEAPNGELMTINTYFDMHPECVLGDMKVESTQYGYDTTCKARDGEDFAEALKNISFTADDSLLEYAVEEQESSLDYLPADPSVRNFSYTLVDDTVYFRENSRMVPQTFKNEDVENRVRALINLRNSVRLLIEMQTEDYSDSAIAKQRQVLNSIYDNFTKKYGLINDRKNKKAFESDSSYYLLASLENLDDEGKLKSKADIFYKRTIMPHVAVTHVDTSAEALEVSISEKACVDIPYMMELSGKTAEEIEKDLTGVVFRVPNKLHADGTPFFVPADEYLSGNVREKLKVAKEFAANDSVFASNVAALEMVQPKDLDASEISVRLGSTWIEPKYVEQFMYELLDTPSWAKDESYGVKVKFADITGEWFIENKTRDNYNVKANTTYGSKRISAYKIIEDTLNLRDARVYDYVEDENGRKKAVLNRDETTIAQQKQESIKEAFVEWIWKDPERREHLTSYYNENFNNIRPREYDGSHLSFGGMNPEITLRKHQLNAIARIIYGGNTLLAHAVGAGKTFEMVAAAQESKRLGLCSKSMFVVPNHLIEQFASDYMKLYPSANVLCSTKKDFEPGNRKKFCSRIATGDYDAIIIGHSQFEKIPMSVEGQRRALQGQLDDIVNGIRQLKEENGQRFTVKQLEKTKKNLEAKLESLNDESRKDDVVTFEELGVDRLFVDEAHYYKNLFLYTKMRNVAGIGSREAQKSSDLYMKCRYLDELTGGKGVIFATGTPVSNSMTELYTMQRYLQYDMLCRRGLQHFDSWASTFGETVTAIELAPEGTGYRAKTRFARFYNLPELIASFKEVADVQTDDMLHLPVPKANFHTVSLQPSEIQQDIVQTLAERAELIHDKRVRPNEDNMLLVTNDGRKLALDQRLIDPMLPDDEASKVVTCANNVFDIWKQTMDFKGTQLVFCDLSTPKSGNEFDVYNDLRKKLIEKGIPKNEIAFIHNAKTDKQKTTLFEKMRKGQVRVLLGSTSKLGVGTNVQERLVALHDIDCPWRPSDLEQRLGRIVRQGNTNDEVDIYRYVTKDTFDAYSWQLIENKQSFISQIFTSKSPARSAEDIDESVLSYAEIKSLATGDPRIKEKMDLDVSVKRLKLLKQSFLREKYSLEDAVLKRYPRDIALYSDRIEKCKKDIVLLEQNTSEDKEYFFPMTVDGKVYTDKGEAGDALIAYCKGHKSFSSGACPCGEYRGFQILMDYDLWNKTFKLVLKNQLSYTMALGSDKFGNITRINNLLASLPKRLDEYEKGLTDTRMQLENAKVQLEKPFAHEQELKKKSARLDELNIELSLDKDNSIDLSVSLDENEHSTRESAVKDRDSER